MLVDYKKGRDIDDQLCSVLENIRKKRHHSVPADSWIQLQHRYTGYLKKKQQYNIEHIARYLRYDWLWYFWCCGIHKRQKIMLIVSDFITCNQHFSTVYNSQSVESIPGLPAASSHHIMFLLSSGTLSFICCIFIY